jgi:putative ABC transport system permease protein
MVDLATKSLLHDKLRFLITVSGVAFAVALVFVQVGLFLGLLDNASVTIEHIDADLWVTSRNTPNVDFAHTFPDTAVKRVRSVPGVARADNLIIWFVTVNLPSGAQEGSLVYALDDFSRWNIPWNVEPGSAELSDLKRGQYFFLDDSAVKRYGQFALGEYREILGQRMKIIGRTKDARSFTTTPISFIDFDRAQTLNPQSLQGKTTYVLVKLAPGADAAAVKAEIARRLPYNDVYSKKEWAQRWRRYWVQSTGIGLNMYITVFLGCLVGIVVVAQTLYTSTMEHIKEFGTVKAIGGGNLDIYRILGKQASIAAVAGFVLGALMAGAMRPAIAKIDLKLIIPPVFAAIVFVGAILMCLGAALISFRKVASIDPALVFRG